MGLIIQKPQSLEGNINVQQHSIYSVGPTKYATLQNYLFLQNDWKDNRETSATVEIAAGISNSHSCCDSNLLHNSFVYD